MTEAIMWIALIRWFANIGIRWHFAADLVFVCFAFLCVGTRLLVLIPVCQLGFGLLPLFVKDSLLHLNSLDCFDLVNKLVANNYMTLYAFILQAYLPFARNRAPEELFQLYFRQHVCWLAW